ncbi:energy transducer TonB [Brevundimonas sp. FT23028]|uniref:energy transducer TonB n=1 Tax=Brevundimonas sp. FT23028 TaxID=3393748 RepID=UPI003B58B08D
MRGRFQRAGLTLAAGLLALTAADATQAQAGQSVPSPPSGSPAPQGSVEYTHPPVVTDLAWVHRAAPDFPSRAMANGITSGRVNLRCTAGENGALTDCEIMEETPAEQGFGRAALDAARRSRVRPRTENGVAVPSEARFTIVFLSPVEPIETGPAAPADPGAPVVIKEIVPIPAPSGD